MGGLFCRYGSDCRGIGLIYMQLSTVWTVSMINSWGIYNECAC